MTSIDTPILKDDAGIALLWPKHKVYTRTSLKTGTWQEVDYLDPLELTERSSPEVSQLTLLYHAGNVLHVDMDGYAVKSPQDLIGQFVRVDLFDPSDADDTTSGDGGDDTTSGDGGDDDSTPAPLRSWVGWITRDERIVGAAGADGSTPQPTDQHLIAIGLEGYLDQLTVYGWFAYDRALGGDLSSQAQHCSSSLAFNEQGQIGLKKYGNRCANKIKVIGSDGTPLDPEVMAYAFDALPRDDKTPSDVWNARDIVEYLIKYHVLDFDIDLPLLADDGGDDDDDPQVAVGNALALITPMRFMANGMTVKQALDRVLRAERGVGWCLRSDQTVGVTDTGDTDQPVTVTLHIFSIFDEDLTIDEATLPANDETMSIDISTDKDVLENAVGEERSEEYGYVFAVGERVLSCFTVSYDDSTLEADWTAKEESDYITTAKREAVPTGPQPDFDGPPPEVDDLDQLSHVFTRLRVPWDWDGTAGDGQGGDHQLVSPVMDNDGVATENPSTLNRQQAGFEYYLPILTTTRTADTDFNPAADQQYMPAFALVRWPRDTSTAGDGSGPFIDKYAFLTRPPHMGDPLNQPSAGVEWPHERHSLWISHLEKPHQMANSQGWTIPDKGFIDSNYSVPAYYSWKEVIATVALRLDQRLYSYRQITGTTSIKKLYIDVPDAELWIVAPNTVSGIASDGTLTTYSGAARTRDDTHKLIQVAEMAQAWYGKPRSSLAIKWAGFKSGFVIGGIVSTVTDAGGSPVNLPLTSVSYDFVGYATTVACNFRPLEFRDA